MKRKILTFLLSLIILSSTFCISGCINIFNKIDSYLAVIPTDREYEANFNYSLNTNLGSHVRNWYVARTNKAVAGQNRDIIYMEYQLINPENETYNREVTYLYVESTVFFWNEGHWEKYETSPNRPYDTWDNTYGSYSKPSTFVYELTQPINGRDFAQRDKTNTTSEYIEYSIKNEEVIRIANNMYHVLLYYKFDYVKNANDYSHELKQATFNFTAPSKVIDTSSITQDMLTQNS